MATPPPVHSSSVLIEPAVVAPTLEWYQFYEKRAVGRALGLGLIGTSSAALLAVFKPWTWFSGPSTNRKALKSSSSYTVLPAALSVIALVVGIRLRTRKYFKDPVALKEYLELYHNSSFSIAFKDLGGWEGINRVATHGMVQAKLEREMAGYVPGAQTSRLSFDDMWQLFNEVSRHPKLLQELLQRKLVDVTELRNRALEDLERSLSNGDQTSQNTGIKPSGPPVDEGVAIMATQVFKRWPGLSDSGPRHLIHRLVEYGDFLQAFLGIPAAILQAAVRSDPDIKDLTFEQLMASEFRPLLSGSPPLFDHGIVRSKAQLHLTQHNPTFGLFITSFGKWLFTENILSIELLATQFQRDCINALDCVTLLDTWYEWPIQANAHKLDITPAQQQVLASLYAQLQTARNSHQKTSKHNRQTFDSGVKKAQSTRDQKLKLRKQAEAGSSSSPASSSANSNEIPIVHVKSNGSTSVSGFSSSTPPVDAANTEERINAEYDSEEMRLQEELDEKLLSSQKSLDEVVRTINESWSRCLHPELAKGDGSGSNGGVQLNVNLSLLGGLSVSAGTSQNK